MPMSPSGSTPDNGASGVVRITHVRAKAGELAALLVALHANAESARQAPGCHNAEVCRAPDEPDAALVISRWESDAALRAFLDWHEGVAHTSIADSAADKPHSLHCPVVPPAA